MKFCIVGAGAIGGMVGAKLANAGHEVALIARGPHLAAIREKGLRYSSADEDFTVQVEASENPADIGPVDVVIISLKAHSVPAMAEKMVPLFKEDTSVITAMNGLPWWYFQRHGGEMEGTILESLDPGGIITKHIAPERVIGCMVLPAAEIAEPGHIKHTEGLKFPIGELDGTISDRIKAISGAMEEAGFKCPITEDIRHDLWVKLMGNVPLNPISALTGATLVEITEHPAVRPLVAESMQEVLNCCAKLGMEISVTVERRIEGARRVGAHKTSMLQDLEAGRPMELECMVGAVLELGQKLGVPMPYTQAIYATTKLLGEVKDGAVSSLFADQEKSA